MEYRFGDIRRNRFLIVAINRFPSDTPAEIDAIAGFCAELGVHSAVVETFEKGGAGARDLAIGVIELTEGRAAPELRTLYPPSSSIEEKASVIAREIYGAGDVYFESAARKKIERYTSLGYSSLPVCMAKTQSSLSDNPKLRGAPSGWTLTVTDAYLAAGAGFIVVVAGNMMLMPGLSKEPQAMKMDADEQGNVIGLV